MGAGAPAVVASSAAREHANGRGRRLEKELTGRPRLAAREKEEWRGLPVGQSTRGERGRRGPREKLVQAESREGEGIPFYFSTNFQSSFSN